MPGTTGDSPNQRLGAKARQDGVQVVRRADGRRAAHGDDVCLTAAESVGELVGIVADQLGADEPPTGTSDEARQHRAYGVSNTAGPRQSATHDLVTGDDDANPGRLGHREGVVADARRKPDHGRGDTPSGWYQRGPRRTHLAAASDMPTGCAHGPADHVPIAAGLLIRQNGIGTRGHRRTSRDLETLPVPQRVRR